MAEQYHSGDIWSAIRSGIANHRERLIQAFDSQSYEKESALLDDVARKVAQAIEPMVQTYSTRK